MHHFNTIEFNVVIPFTTFEQISRISNSPKLCVSPSVRVIINPGSPLSPFSPFSPLKPCHKNYLVSFYSSYIAIKIDTKFLIFKCYISSSSSSWTLDWAFLFNCWCCRWFYIYWLNYR